MGLNVFFSKSYHIQEVIIRILNTYAREVLYKV